MVPTPKIVVTGTGAICAVGRTPDEIWDAVLGGRSAIAPLQQWDASNWPTQIAAEVTDYQPAKLLEDRKVLKLIRRTDVFGLYAAARAIEHSGLIGHRDGLDADAVTAFNDRSAVYVGSGGGTYESQYDYFPLLTVAAGSLEVFGRELENTVNPMWLLRALPNNVLCHIGIRYGLKGANACITNHSVAGSMAIGEAVAALRAGEADRAVVVGHDALIEPQQVLYYQRAGLLTSDTIRPFDANRAGSAFGEGAGALVLETDAAAAARGATVLGECLGSGATTDAQGLLAIRDDGDGLARAIAAALEDAGITDADVGMIVAHGNGTRQSDASEAAAIRRVFGVAPPPVTAFKWAFGHLIAASGIAETVIGLRALREGVVPGIATLRELDPECAGLPAAATPRAPRSDIALVLSRGFAGTNAALLVRASATAKH
ncbi:MAG: beta-ketoacyl-[acyl-carrier-protein] synthase family protein [Betaproteobacteria bacterium]|nr:beta-ketoacyl-[acyl-carrier-protein] synthase family protein [Betaproteobacteria bacterium]